MVILITKVSLKPVVEIGDTHKVKIDGHTGDITGLTNVDRTDPTFATNRVVQQLKNN